MTSGQKKVLNDAFLLLINGAKRGQRLVRDDATPADVKKHVDEIAWMVGEMQKALDEHLGASHVTARAKALSSSKSS